MDNPEDDGTALRRRTRRPVGRYGVPVGPSDTDRQVQEFKYRCGPVTVSRTPPQKEEPTDA